MFFTPFCRKPAIVRIVEDQQLRTRCSDEEAARVSK
jgi:hypothetical protein